MPNVTTAAAYQQILSMAVEDRSSGYQDLVSNNNALLAVMKRKGLWQTYSGPFIRQTLQIGKQSAQWYSGYDQLLNPAIDLFNDAVYSPKWLSCRSSCRFRRSSTTKARARSSTCSKAIWRQQSVRSRTQWMRASTRT